jgi:hypothetical protein
MFDNVEAAFLGFVDRRNVSSCEACIVTGEIRALQRAIPTHKHHAKTSARTGSGPKRYDAASRFDRKILYR